MATNGKKSKMIGKVAYVTDKESIYFEEWGVIAQFDGECYHLKIANGSGAMPMFDRDQLYVPRQQQKMNSALRVIQG